ncbi:hypothetical protein PTSG_06606 [Salpingoeca rosetta]|uniref:Uncharacterized protein n=1 Tax=Salpingoeca rosetta (strain ATCC 50818 / BSB-021) TaxID=946362 RepID=F2UFG8_SALR5|nr:uncharacterized protein PTSG_06606 [Salpingoeca rosetta]EGD75536.1 hypothetical protein PTSG_06606 [Salpingoeca rosetta]|eukprot:XP_004991993.1 hypothetical protein PTSG_06606 [Salpingoeca rosetta]
MTTHQEPKEGAACMCCFDELRNKVGSEGEDEEPINYVEYRTSPSSPWKPSGYCEDCLRHLMSIKFNKFLDDVKKADCGRSLRNLLLAGPPLYMKDATALPVDDDEDDNGPKKANDDDDGDEESKPAAQAATKEVTELWFASSDSEAPAKVDNAVEGTERSKLWLQLIVDNKARLDDSTSLDNLIATLKAEVGDAE